MSWLSPPPPRARAQPRTWCRSSRPPGSGSRTRGSRRGSRVLFWRRRLGGEDVRQALEVGAEGRALTILDRALEARDELRAQDVDLAVQDPAAVRELVLLLLQLGDQLAQLGIWKAGKVGKRFHGGLS